MLARIVDGQPEEVKLADVVAEMGGKAKVSLPRPLNDAALANLDLHRVRPGVRPSDTLTRKARAGGLEVNGETVVRSWTLEPLPLDAAKAALRARVNAMKAEKQSGGISTIHGRVDSDPDSRSKVNDAALMALLAEREGASFEKFWTLADDTDAKLDGSQMIALARAMTDHDAACHSRTRALKAEIGKARTIAALEKIDLEAGWP